MTHTVLVGGACHERKTGIVLRDKYFMGSDGGTPFRRYSHPLSYQQHFSNRTLFLIHIYREAQRNWYGKLSWPTKCIVTCFPASCG